MAKRTGGFIGQDGINAPDPATGVTGTAGDGQVTVSWTAPSDVGGAAITGYSVVADDGSSFNIPNISAATLQNTFDVSAQDAEPTGIQFKSDGTKMYLLGDVGASVYQYSLSSAWDVSSASYDSVSFSVGSQENGPRGLFFKPDGTAFYISGYLSDSVFQYSLSTAWDLSTASYASKSFSVASQTAQPGDVDFKSDGTKMYVAGGNTAYLYQYSLSTAWDVSTASYDSKTLNTASQGVTDLSTVFFNSSGTAVYGVGESDILYEYVLSTAWDISTGSYSGSSFSILTEDSNHKGSAIKTDNKTFYTVGQNSDSVYQYYAGGYPTSSPVTITGLTNGTSYTFNVWAINPFGWSSPSDASGGVTPDVLRRGVFSGGSEVEGDQNFTNSIEYISIASTGNSTDFGNLLAPVRQLTSVASSTRGVMLGGAPEGSNAQNTIQYITIATTGDALDFGDIASGGASSSSACSSGTRGVQGGGYPLSGYTIQSAITYITIASAGNTSSFGSLTDARRNLAACASTTRGVFAGGERSGNKNVIDYITIASTGNATDFGDLTVARQNLQGCSNSTRGIFGGGNPSSNTMDYITISSTGNASDFGDFQSSSAGAYTHASCASSSRAIFTGAGSSNEEKNLGYVEIATTGNTSDFGDLSVLTRYMAGLSNVHGGL